MGEYILVCRIKMTQVHVDYFIEDCFKIIADYFGELDLDFVEDFATVIGVERNQKLEYILWQNQNSVEGSLLDIFKYMKFRYPKSFGLKITAAFRKLELLAEFECICEAIEVREPFFRKYKKKKQ